MMRVTGNNLSVANKVMSIRLLLDGHNFSHTSHTLRSTSVEQGAEVVVSFDTARAVLVPAYLCEEGVGEAYLRFGGIEPSDDERIICSEKQGETIAVMAVNEAIVSLIEKEMAGRTVRYTSPLMEIARGEKRNVNIFLTLRNAYVVVWDKGLRYVEVLPDSSPDSVLYYLQELGGEFRLKKFDICVGGERAGEVVASVGEYFKNVRLIDFQ
jgi:hypothetical protein